MKNCTKRTGSFILTAFLVCAHVPSVIPCPKAALESEGACWLSAAAHQPHSAALGDTSQASEGFSHVKIQIRQLRDQLHSLLPGDLAPWFQRVPDGMTNSEVAVRYIV